MKDGPIQLICTLIVSTAEMRNLEHIAALLTQLTRYPAAKILQTLRWHHLEIPFWIALKTHSISLPDSLTKPLRARLQDLQIRVISQQAALREIDDLLSKQGIIYIPFKGILLSQQLNNVVTSRHCKDIDIWIALEDIDRATQVFQDAGYSDTSDEPRQSFIQRAEARGVRKDKVLVSPNNPGVEVELHWRLDKNKFMYDFDFKQAAAQLESVALDGRLYPTFSLPLYLRYLPIHGSMAMWGRLKWLLDWHEASAKADQLDFDWGELADGLVINGLLQPTLIAINLSHSLFGQSIPKAFKKYKLTTWSRMTVWAINRSVRHNRYPGLLLRWVLRLFLRESRAYKLEQFSLLFKQLRRPNLRR